MKANRRAWRVRKFAVIAVTQGICCLQGPIHLFPKNHREQSKDP